MQFDVDDEFSAKNDTLEVKYAFSDYISFYATTFPPQNISGILKKFTHESIESYSLILHHNGILHKKDKSSNKPFTKYFKNLLRKNKLIPERKPFT